MTAQVQAPTPQEVMSLDDCKCGSPAAVRYHKIEGLENMISISCVKCGISTPMTITVNEAREIWNARAQ